MVFEISNIPLFKKKALQWASSFKAVCYLDSNQFTGNYTKFDTFIAIGVDDELQASAGSAFEQLAAFRKKNQGWISGFFSYELKNEVERLSSDNIDNLHFPDLYFFAALHHIVILGNLANINSANPQQVFDGINGQEVPVSDKPDNIKLRARFSKGSYIHCVQQIKEHISRGDIYISNFCQEFYAEEAVINPVQTFIKLNNLSPTPFSCFFKWQNNYIMCASPERFLAKRGSKLISQPIKGTAKRAADSTEDRLLKQHLQTHPKELQENVMIVDLVRNDLTLSAKKGTVKTEELFGLHSFKQVHQLISTVVCEMRDDISPIQAIKNSFPMGSMTGAPKISSMQLMEQYELSKRGVYSGAVGYFSPDNDFDLNVVIRSIQYNAEKKYLSFQVGSAITFDAEAGQEYEECLIKAQAILEVLGQPKSFPQSGPQ